MPEGGTVADSGPICPWCSAPLPGEAEVRCPSCSAALHETETAEVPGLTRVDHDALLRSRAPAQRSRGLIGWLSGEYQPEAPPEAPGTLAPPADDVRREMLRLELAALEAEVLARQAEAAALAADASEGVPGDAGLAADTDNVAEAPRSEPGDAAIATADEAGKEPPAG